MTDSEIEVVGDSIEEARAHLLSQIPEGIRLLSQEVVSTGDPIWVVVDATTEDDARSQARKRPLAILSVDLVAPATHGLLGLSGRPARYKITYQTKARIRARLGVRYCQSCGSAGAEKHGAPNVDSWFCNEACDRRFHDQFFQFTLRDIRAAGGTIVSLGGGLPLADGTPIVIFCAHCAARHVLAPSQSTVRAATCNACKRKLL
jgi:hypothetical protein